MLKCAACQKNSMRDTGLYEFTSPEFVDDPPIDALQYRRYECDECGYVVGRKPGGAHSDDARYNEVIGITESLC